MSEVVGNALNIIVTPFDVAGLPEEQVAFDVITTLITSPLTNVVDVQVDEVSPLMAVAPLYHWYAGIVPPLVGEAVNVTEDPAQIEFADSKILTEAGKFGLTVIVTTFDVTGLPVEHVAFDVIFTVIASLLTNVVDVQVDEVSPLMAVAPLYHWYAGTVPPLVGVAVNVTEDPAQIEFAVAKILTEAIKFALTVIVTTFDVAGLPVEHVAFDVICTVIASLLTNVVDVQVDEVSPLMAVAPLYHWYAGVAPPLIAVAVNITEDPAQIGFADAKILTEAGKFALTVIVTTFDVAGLPVEHVAFDVIFTVIASLLTNVVDVQVDEVSPLMAVAPLYHWYAGVAPPLIAVAVNVTEDATQIGFADAKILTEAGKFGLTVIVTTFDVAGLPVEHVAFDVICTVIASLLTNVVDVQVDEVSPLMAVAPLYHWYAGVAPSLIAVAVNITEDPAQIGFADAKILTEAGKFGDIVTPKVFSEGVQLLILSIT